MFRASLLFAADGQCAVGGASRRGCVSRWESNAPRKLPVTPALEAALRRMGISYLNYYIYNKLDDLPAAEINDAMMSLCDRLGSTIR